MQRCLDQWAWVPHQKHVARFEIAVRVPARPLQRQAAGDDTKKYVPQSLAVHAAAAGDPRLEVVPRIKIGDVPNSFGRHSEGVDRREAASSVGVRFFLLLDAF